MIDDIYIRRYYLSYNALYKQITKRGIVRIDMNKQILEFIGGLIITFELYNVVMSTVK